MIFNEDPLGRMHSDLVLWISGAKARERMGGQRKGQEEKKVWSARISNESNILRAVCRRKLSHEYENS